MISTIGSANAGLVVARGVSGRGFTPEEIAESALDRIIYVGAGANPLIKAQADAYKDEIRKVLVHYMKQVVASHNTTLMNRFNAAGHPELVTLLGA
tara:strand:+ start:1707 stop:1994 length:288 start_codon:yes stop_codon:yes gene_type:complete